jgi:hypothetical protein
MCLAVSNLIVFTASYLPGTQALCVPMSIYVFLPKYSGSNQIV